MTLALVLVAFAASALVLTLIIVAHRRLQLSSRTDLGVRIQPLDVEALRNLIDPQDTEYLRCRLPGSEFHHVQRERLRAVASYIRIARHNAYVLSQIAERAMLSTNPQTVEAAIQLKQSAVLLRRNATIAILNVYIAWAWPDSPAAVARVLHGYERLSGSAMLLGRLQAPAVAVRVSVR